MNINYYGTMYLLDTLCYDYNDEGVRYVADVVSKEIEYSMFGSSKEDALILLHIHIQEYIKITDKELLNIDDMYKYVSNKIYEEFKEGI